MVHSSKEKDIQILLDSNCHLIAGYRDADSQKRRIQKKGRCVYRCRNSRKNKSCDKQMARYVYRRRDDQSYVINLNDTWEKLQLAARVIVSIGDTREIKIQDTKQNNGNAIQLFSTFTGVKASLGRHTPGTFTNHTHKKFEEPRLLFVTDPFEDHNSILETIFVNIPVVAICDVNSCLKYVDIAIPANNNSEISVRAIFYLLTLMVEQMKNSSVDIQKIKKKFFRDSDIHQETEDISEIDILPEKQFENNTDNTNCNTNSSHCNTP